ncbi:hypothetical protein fugu_006269, partial [Takifugu bimaculatus]
KMKGFYDSQAPACPVCQVVLRPGELQDHMEQELSKVAQLHISGSPVQHDHAARTPKSLSLSLHIKREGGSPTSPPRPAEDAHSDRYQTFLRVRANRHTRLNVRIGKLKRKKAEDGQEGSGDLAEDEWNERRRLHMTTLVRGLRDAVLVSTTSKECRDSDADLDVDGDDTLEYGRAQYTETDVIPCPGESSQESAAKESVHQQRGQSGLQRVRPPQNLQKPRVRNDTYTTPLTSIQCWHVHCEECWLRTLGAKKLCPQCNTITSPGDLRRVFL